MNEQTKQEFLKKVEGYDPMQNIPSELGEAESVLKTWFRLTYPEGRIVECIKMLNQSIAIVETRVYADRQGDNSLIANRLGIGYNTKGDTTGEYVKKAEREATMLAIKDAGFGITQALPPAKRGRGSKGEKAAPAPAQAEVVASPPQPAAAPDTTDEPVMAEEQTADAEEGKDEEPKTKTAAETAAVTTPTVAPKEPIDISKAETPSVEELLETMSVEDAVNTQITFGQDSGKTLGQIIKEDPKKVIWFRDSYQGPDNRLKAGAKLLMMQAGDTAA